MNEQELDNWWWNLSFKKIRKIAFDNYGFSKEDKDNEDAFDWWWRDLSLDRKAEVYKLNK